MIFALSSSYFFRSNLVDDQNFHQRRSEVSSIAPRRFPSSKALIAVEGDALDLHLGAFHDIHMHGLARSRRSRTVTRSP